MAIDGNPARVIAVEGTESMGNGTPGAMGPASVNLRALPFPSRTMTFSNLFPGETVAFAFDALPSQARQTLSACFTAAQ